MTEVPREKVEITNEGKVIISVPRTVFSGECDHYWIKGEKDPEGKLQISCRNCPIGHLIDPKKTDVADGKLVEK